MPTGHGGDLAWLTSVRAILTLLAREHCCADNNLFEYGPVIVLKYFPTVAPGASWQINQTEEILEILQVDLHCSGYAYILVQERMQMGNKIAILFISLENIKGSGQKTPEQGHARCEGKAGS
jgi:hypothetical protein